MYSNPFAIFAPNFLFTDLFDYLTYSGGVILKAELLSNSSGITIVSRGFRIALFTGIEDPYFGDGTLYTVSGTGFGSYTYTFNTATSGQYIVRAWVQMSNGIKYWSDAAGFVWS